MAAMQQEIELKFRIPAGRLAAVRQAVFTHKAKVLPLAAAYFDTPGEHLAQARVALRLRREGEQWVQTLKAQAADPLVRLEHNVDVPGPQRPELDLARHAGTPAGERLHQVLQAAPGQALATRYATDIQRTLRPLRHASGAVIELALDEGHILAGPHSLVVSELELELLSGQPAALLAVAERWARRFGLLLDTRSKSERGHLLAAGQGCSAPLALKPPAEGASHRAQLGACLGPLLASASVLADDDLTPPQAHLAALQQAMSRLAATLAAWGDPPVDGLGHGLLAAVQALQARVQACPEAGVHRLMMAPSTQALWLALLWLAQGR